MQSQAKMILGNLIQQKLMVGQNFVDILNVLEDVVVGAVVTAAITPSSDLVANDPKDILNEFAKRVRGKLKELAPLNIKDIVRAAIVTRQMEEEARARTEEEGK